MTHQGGRNPLPERAYEPDTVPAATVGKPPAGEQGAAAAGRGLAPPTRENNMFAAFSSEGGSAIAPP